MISKIFVITYLHDHLVKKKSIISFVQPCDHPSPTRHHPTSHSLTLPKYITALKLPKTFA
jgi:hypothetical protein